MEAARVSAERGHKVVLFEAASHLGGQILLAARAGWRKDMIGISDWLASEIDHLAVDVHLNRYAEKSDVVAENPDVVIIASGGVPQQNLPEGGGELALTCWDLLEGHVNVGENVLLYDETGDHAGMSTADMLSSRSMALTIATPNRMAGLAIGGQNYPIYMRNLIRQGACIVPDRRLLSLESRRNQITARFQDVYLRETEEMEFDQVVLVMGTMPMDELFHELAKGSINDGELDLDAFLQGEPQVADIAEQDSYLLFRIGDAVASRNVHAAIYDAQRLCSTL